MGKQNINEKFQAGLAPEKIVDHRKHATVSSASTKDRVTININEAQNPFDPVDVQVQVNGRMYQIKRGVDVGVPPEVVHALDNAEIGRARQKIDEKGMPAGVEFTPAKRFPYRIVDADSMQLYKAWLQASLDLRDAQIAAEQHAA